MNEIQSILESLSSNEPEDRSVEIAQASLVGKDTIYEKINGESRNLHCLEVITVAISKEGHPYMRATWIDRDNDNETADKTVRLEKIRAVNQPS